MGVATGAGVRRDARMPQRAAIFAALVGVEPAGAVLVETLKVPGQPRRTQRRAIWGEGALLVLRAKVERYRGEAAGLVEVVVDVVGIVGRIPGAEARPAPEPGLGLGHQRQEEGRVRLVAGAGAFGEHHLGVVGQPGRHDPRGITPELAHPS